jgi:hypothetical protein
MGPERGKTDVYIDGVLIDQITAKSTPDRRYRVARTYRVTPGTHIIMVEARGAVSGETCDTTNPNPNCGLTDVDAFYVDIPTYSQNLNYDDTHPGIKYSRDSGWNHLRVLNSGLYLDTVSRSQSAEDVATFTFSGSQIYYYFQKGPNGGIAVVTIDGRAVGTIDQYSPSPVNTYARFTVPTGTGTGPHTISITVTGRTNAPSGAFVTVDRFNPQQ